jgi:hypothetical protein
MALKPPQRVENIVQAHVQSKWLAIQPIPNLASRHRTFRQQLDDFLLQHFHGSFLSLSPLLSYWHPKSIAGAWYRPPKGLLLALRFWPRGKRYGEGHGQGVAFVR